MEADFFEKNSFTYNYDGDLVDFRKPVPRVVLQVDYQGTSSTQVTSSNKAKLKLVQKKGGF